MRILLIGADGQVGGELVSRLATLGEVVSTTRSGSLPDGRSCGQLDLQEHDRLKAAVGEPGTGLVVNAAAYTAVDRAESEPEQAFAINAAAPGVLAAECARLGIPLVHFSTDYVFPGTGSRPLREDDPVGPLSVYGSSKLAGEEAVRAAGGPYKIFRLCWVYGARGKNFFLTMLRLAEEREELGVVSDQFGCPTPAAWIADAVVQSLSSKPGLSGIWHLASSGHTSWHGFAEAIMDDALASGRLARRPVVREISTAEYPTPAHRPGYSVLDCTRLEADFGIRLPDWRRGVPEVMAST
jgi:dTDP-4-dehydrorhamnose reductase